MMPYPLQISSDDNSPYTLKRFLMLVKYFNKMTCSNFVLAHIECSYGHINLITSCWRTIAFHLGGAYVANSVVTNMFGT